MSILRQASTPVNLYSGVPSISVPIHNLQGRGASGVPISLLYNASGNKVQDVSSNVGLGWSISSNSLVTRVVRGLPDEALNGYFGSDMGNKIAGTLDFYV
ncbi:SpvB/TcaC N-terminal domain-containing protein [Pedobacter sp. FW305-3-2-15-E-R2A2]|uniref:SpvB/TcaC N-terminal domain-containing protein n=1 Tax=Pedobacter sp. FW305-3-2-15-E-R2A2 TaxID=3140251 RepID=UPI0031406974